MSMLAFQPTQKVINITAPHGVSISGKLNKRHLTYVSPRIETWASAYMKFSNLFKKPEPVVVRKLVDQIEALQDSKYYEYFIHILSISKARDITEITEEDIEAYMLHVQEFYYYPLRIREAAVAIRYLMSQYRKLGYPMLRANEVQRICNKHDRFAQTY